MSKRFSRNIFPGDGTKEPLDTNRVGDFLISSKESDSRYGKGDAWIRKEGGYHCLTDNIKSLTSDLADIVGITSTGKNSRRLKVNPEILTNDKVKTSGLIQKTDSGSDGITLGLGIETIADGLRELNQFLEIDQESLDEIAEQGEVDEYIRLRNKDHVFNVPTYKYVKGLDGGSSEGGTSVPNNLVTFDKINEFEEQEAGVFNFDSKYFNVFNNLEDETDFGSTINGAFITLKDSVLNQSGGGSVEETFTLDNIELMPPMGKTFAESQFENRLLIDSKDQYLHLETQNENGEDYKNKYLTFNDDLLKREISSEVRNAIGENNDNSSTPENVLTRDDIGDGNGAELVSRTNIGANFSHIKDISVYENTEITYTQRNVFNNGEAWIRTIEKPEQFKNRITGEKIEGSDLVLEDNSKYILMSRMVVNYHAIDYYRENKVELNIPIEQGGDMSINDGIISLVTPNLPENTLEIKNYIVRNSYAYNELISYYNNGSNELTNYDKERTPMVSNYILSRFDVEKTLEGNSENNE